MDTGLPMEFDPKENGPEELGNADAVASRELAEAVRVLAMGAAETATSDAFLDMADVATVLWSQFLKFDPTRPDWADRDRFLMTAGKGSMLQNALLHLTGHEGIAIEAPKSDRHRDSGRPRHPALGRAASVRKLTPRFGQDLSNAVGVALAERLMAEQHGADLIDHNTFMLASHSCLEGDASQQAASLAARMKLGRLIVCLDDATASNGAKNDVRSDDIVERFEACGWHVCRIDGHDHDEIARAIERAKSEERPSLIACKTTACEAAAGSTSSFAVSEEIKQAWASVAERGKVARAAWDRLFEGKDVATRARFGRAQAGGLCDSWRTALEDHCRKLVQGQPAMAGPLASQAALETLTQSAPNILDVANVDGQDPGAEGHEHLLAAVMNGIAQHGGLLPYGGIVQGFRGNARSAIRQAALMGLRVVYVMTPDSGLGDDQAKHRSTDHLASLRAIPNLDVMRPADAVEMAECWALALRRREGPSVLALSHQTMPTLRKTHSEDNHSERGAYVLAEASSGPRAITLLATGAEVQIALEARERLEAMGMPTAVVSMPCFERFDQQPFAYRASVLGAAPRLAIEAAGPFGWTRYVDSKDDVISAANSAAGRADHGGITVEAIIIHVLDKVGRRLRAAA